MNSKRNYLAHTGVKGQKHGVRNYQSYETAPTRSGMVGEERGEAAKQRERKRLSKEEKKEAKLEKFRNKLYKEADRAYTKNIARQTKKIKYEGDKHYAKAKSWQEEKDAIDDSIKKMSINDLKVERRARRGEALLSASLGFTFGIPGAAVASAVVAPSRVTRVYKRAGLNYKKAGYDWKKYYNKRK